MAVRGNPGGFVEGEHKNIYIAGDTCAEYGHETHSDAH
jgi:hypothetical protein